MKILLVNPPRVDGHPVVREERQEHSDYVIVYPPLSMLYCAAILRQGFNTMILDANGFDFGMEYVSQVIKEEEPDVVYIRCAIDTIEEDLEVLRIAKSFGCMTILRNKIMSDAAWLRDKVMKEHLFVDFFIDGEPEEVLPKLLRNMHRPERVKGITWRSEDGIVSEGSKPIVRDLDSLPFPAYYMLPNLKPYKTGLFPSPSVIVYTCYDEDTEVLTKNGWKFFRDLRGDDEVATLEQGSFHLEYQIPSEIIKEEYNGKMYFMSVRAFELMVTPNHTLFVKRNRKNSDFELIMAKDIKNTSTLRFKKDAIWNGEDQEFFILPYAIHDLNPVNNPDNKMVMTPKKIPMDIWLEFFGYYIADGNIQKKKTNNYTIKITKSERHNFKKFKKIEKCFDKLGYNYNYVEPKKIGDRKGFYINNKQLYTYLKQFGKNYEKYIPIEIKQLSSRQLKILFEALMLCDGYIKNPKHKIYITASKKLSDDIQEILLKIGKSCNIRIHSEGNSKHKKCYQIFIKNKHEPYLFNCNLKSYRNTKIKSKIKEIQYKGNVYCCEVPNHIIYVRRNGKAVWCGNSRGCPYLCSFCATKSRYRMRSPESVIEELKMLKKEFKIKNFVFYDDTMTVDRERAMRIAALMIEEKLDMKWALCTRVDHINKLMLDLFKKAGCIELSYGIESGSQEMLNRIRKGITLEQARNAHKWTQEAGIKDIALMMIGLPGETEESARATIDFVKDVNAYYAQFSFVIPFPNTEVWDYYKDNGFLLTEDFKKFNPLTVEPIVRTEELTKEDLIRLKNQAYKEMMLRKDFILPKLKDNPLWVIKGGFMYLKRLKDLVVEKYVR